MKIRHVMLGMLALPVLGLLAIAAFLAWGNRPVPQDLRLEGVAVVDTKSIGIDDSRLTALADRHPTLLRMDLSTSGKLGTRAVQESMNVWSRASPWPVSGSRLPRLPLSPRRRPRPARRRLPPSHGHHSATTGPRRRCGCR